ncbi:hypothetical protein ACFXAF_32590 [Kitasatospora sp. NPDC059463]|uniref:hypothetical protein n=1 Tax=unclassified Kitasatospora TaxID=2633591 RepID=UPI0036C7B626
MNLRRKLATLGTTLAAATGAAVLPAVPAHAAADCWDAGWTYTGTVGGTVSGSWRVHSCNNVPNTSVRSQPSSAYPVTGTMSSNPSWFVCKTDEGGYNGGGPHPYRWLWTQSDTGAWGWMADSAIYSETNPVPDCITG